MSELASVAALSRPELEALALELQQMNLTLTELLLEAGKRLALDPSAGLDPVWQADMVLTVVGGLQRGSVLFVDRLKALQAPAVGTAN